MNLGSRLKSIRSDKGLSQKELSHKSGVNQSTISRLEASDATKSSYAPELAKALGVSTAYLLGLESNKANSRVELREIPILSYNESLEYKEVLSAHQNKNKNNLNREYLVVPEDAALSNDCFAVILNDDSMSPEFKKHDQVAIDPKRALSPGDYAWCKHPSRKDPYLRLFREKTKGCELVPLNQNYATDEHEDADEVVIGRLVRKVVIY